MSEQDWDKGLFDFRDASAYFSTEEWKLLHEWQKELYRNVMKEIHQALTSLGPLIASTVLSLKHREYQEFSSIDHQESARKPSIMHLPAFPLLTTDVGTRKEEVSNIIVMDHPCTGGGYSSTIPCLAGFPFLNAESSLPVMDESADSLMSHRIAGIEAPISEIVSVHIKEEDVPCSIDNQDSDISKGLISHSGAPLGSEAFRKRTKGIADEVPTQRSDGAEDMTAGERHMDRNKDYESSVYCNEEEKRVLCSSKKETSYRRQVWSENNPAQCGSVLYYQDNQTLNVKAQHIGKTASHNESEISPSKHLACQSKTKDNWSPFMCTESHPSFPGKDNPVKIHGHSAETRLYKCIECEKSFVWKTDLIAHQRTHSGDRVYQCTECGKSFSKKAVLVRHRKIHSGEKPFKCVECGKSFNQKEVLSRHKTIHTGERPFQCVECGKSFNQKEILGRHKRIHARDRPYECAKCGNNFKQKGDLIRHEKIHR